MHELAICLSLIRLIEQNIAAAEPPVKAIKSIRLEIGQLVGIELEALRFSFPIAAAHTVAQNATLEIQVQKGEVFCQPCQQNVMIASRLMPCPMCSQYDYEIIQGTNLKIVHIEVI